MTARFTISGCQTASSRKIFGLCDDPPPAINPAYIDETEGSKWIAVVENDDRHSVTFTAIDHCIVLLRPDEKMGKRCDGMLTHDATVIFVELKQRAAFGNAWVADAEEQLRVTIAHFEQTEEATSFNHRRAYAANSEHPKFKDSQARRMSQFLLDTGYILRIENRIRLQAPDGVW